MSNPPPVMLLGSPLHRHPVVLGCLPHAPPWAAASRGGLRIGYCISGRRLQGQVEIAWRTAATRALTTLVWSGPLDALSRRLLAQAMRQAARPDPPARLHVFAAVAHQLFRHAVLTLAPRPGKRTRRRRARHGPAHSIPKADAESPPLHDDLLTAIDDLSNAAALQPRVTLPDCAAIDLLTRAILPALHALFADLGTCLAQALHPLEPLIGRDAVRAIILETRRGLDGLAACRTAGDAYAESLTIAAAADKPVRIEIEGSLGAAL